MSRRSLLALALSLLTAGPAAGGAKDYLKKPDAWYASAEAARVGANVLSYQSDLGGWPKNTDTTSDPYRGDRGTLKPTYDNGATTDELRLLARLYEATDDGRYRDAFVRGLDYVLNGQYPNGGWPQFTPPGDDYHRYITFNDDAMVRLLTFVREVARSEDDGVVDAPRRRACEDAFARGIDCLLKCQIRRDGKLTAWCAQHDEVDFRPRPARSFEPAALSGAESVGVTLLLMSLDDPSPEVVAAVEGAVAWFESAALTGVRVHTVKDPRAGKGTNKIVVADPAAPPLWARFYDLETNAPVFMDRDGVPKANLADLGDERRNGYAWYGTWPEKVLGDKHRAWQRRVAEDEGSGAADPRPAPSDDPSFPNPTPSNEL